MSPIDGDVMHSRDGRVTDEGIYIKVRVAGGGDITVNDTRGALVDGVNEVEVLLPAFKNDLVVKDVSTGEEKTIHVYWTPKYAGGYRLSIDDNIFFLRDIHEKKYQSIFENPFMGFLKGLHEQYDTKVHLNLFYRTEGFDLSMLSDQYKEEWSAQKDWLRLSFHAMEEFPDKPYVKEGYEVMKRDCAIVLKEIRRFAGDALIGPVTTVHWGEATMEGARALRDMGYKGLLGYFNVDDELPAASYYMTVEERRHLKQRFIWKDDRIDMMFFKTSIVIDKTDLDQIVPHLDAYAEKGGYPPYVDLLVHEQYFYPFYFNYEPDYRQRIETAVKWAKAHGYTPRFLEESIL